MKSLVLVLAGSCGLAMVNLVHAQGAQTVLDENIKVVHYEQMNYPPLARTALAHGVVVISVRLDADGAVADAEAISGNERLIRECISNAKKWRFNPTPQGKAVVVYRFESESVICKDGKQRSVFKFEAPNLAIITACAQVIDHM